MFDSKLLEMALTEYGIIGVVAIIVALILLKVSGPMTWLKKLWMWLKTARRLGNTTPKELLLSKLDYWIKFKIPNLKMQDPGRQLIFRDILKFKFSCFQDYVTKVNERITDNMSGNEVFHEIVHTFNETVDAYEKMAIEHGVPEVVMVKYGEWQLRSYEYTIRAAELICLSNGYGNNTSRLHATFSLVTAMMELTIAEAEKTLTDLNGQLTGTSYRGVVCG